MIRKLASEIKKNYSSIDVDLRYYPIALRLKTYLSARPKILDVGSSGSGIAKYINYSVTGLDIDFGDQVHDLLTPVYQKGKKFPFKNNEFDFVVNVDTIEHITIPDRQGFLSEIIRVAKKQVLIAVPTGSVSAQQDKLLFDYFLRVNGTKDNYLDEHVKNGLPSTDELEEQIKISCEKYNKKCSIEVLKNVNIKFRGVYMHLALNQKPIHKNLYRALSLLNPIWRYFNFGRCYRSLFVIKISAK